MRRASSFKNAKRVFAIALAVSALPTAARADDDQPKVLSATLMSLSPPVTEYGVLDRPYEVIGIIKTEVRKAAFRGEPSQEKVYQELWERAQRMGADAVINAEVGQVRVTLFSSGSRKASGQAIRFSAPAQPVAQALNDTSVQEVAVEIPSVTDPLRESIEAAKIRCLNLGFPEGSDKLGQCVMKLSK